MRHTQHTDQGLPMNMQQCSEVQKNRYQVMHEWLYLAKEENFPCFSDFTSGTSPVWEPYQSEFQHPTIEVNKTQHLPHAYSKEKRE